VPTIDALVVKVVHELVSGIEPWDELEEEHQVDTLRWLESTDDVFRRVKPADPLGDLHTRHPFGREQYYPGPLHHPCRFAPGPDPATQHRALLIGQRQRPYLTGHATQPAKTTNRTTATHH